MNEVPGPEYSIGKNLYTRLSLINQQAPNVDSFPDMAANRAADSSSVSWQPLAAIRLLRREARHQEWISSLVFFSLAISLFFFSPDFREFFMGEQFGRMSPRNP